MSSAFPSEKPFHDWVERYLIDRCGYVKTDEREYDHDLDIIPPALYEFVSETQGDVLDEIGFVMGRAVTPAELARECRRAIRKCGKLGVLRNGFKFKGQRIQVLVHEPIRRDRDECLRFVNANRAQLIRECPVYKGNRRGRIDLVLFVNGLSVAEIELKDGIRQSVDDAIDQIRMRPSSAAIFGDGRSGALLHVAMTPSRCRLSVNFDGHDTEFMGFDRYEREDGDPIDEEREALRRMPPDSLFDPYAQFGSVADRPDDFWSSDADVDGKYDASFLRSVLEKTSLIDIVENYVDERKTEKAPGRGGASRTSLVFPRRHQLRCVRRIVNDVIRNGCDSKYLVAHTTGSGKTYELSHLARILPTLCDSDGRFIFDKLFVISDRNVVVDQNARSIGGMSVDGQIMYARCSSDIARFMSGGRRICVTTIQKFNYVDRGISDSSGRYAIIVDECHGSTSGDEFRNMRDVVSGTDADEPGDVRLDDGDDGVDYAMRRVGRSGNVCLVGFTGTPKESTIRLFGEAFDVYSMQQSIDEGYSVDVIGGSIRTPRTDVRISKGCEDDPLIDPRWAVRATVEGIQVDDGAVRKYARYIADDIHGRVIGRLLPSRFKKQEAAMIVTGSRLAAYKMTLALRALDDGDIRAVGAFTGSLDVDGRDVTQHDLNGFPDSSLPERVSSGEYNVLVVADKYLVGYDEPLMCAMYILKRMRDVKCVQALSRLNRPVRDGRGASGGADANGKETRVVCFVPGGYDDIRDAFSKFRSADAMRVADGLNGRLGSDDVRAVLDDLYDDVMGIPYVPRLVELVCNCGIDARATDGRDGVAGADVGELTRCFEDTLDKLRLMPESDQSDVRMLLRMYVMTFAKASLDARVRNRAGRLYRSAYDTAKMLVKALRKSVGRRRKYDMSDLIVYDSISIADDGMPAQVTVTGDGGSGDAGLVSSGACRNGTSSKESHGDAYERTLSMSVSQFVNAFNAGFGDGTGGGVSAGEVERFVMALISDERVRALAAGNGYDAFKQELGRIVRDAMIAEFDAGDDTGMPFLMLANNGIETFVKMTAETIYNASRA